MGILSGLMGNASEISVEEVKKEFEPLLVEGEKVEKAFKLIRDKFIFTDRRLILVDVQGMVGSKIEYLTIPYKSITRFAKESAGVLDLDAELKIWLSGAPEPVTKKFTKDTNINDIYMLMSKYVLKS